MKAVRFHEYGEADVLRLEEVPDPTPGDEDVIVEVEVCSVQHSEIDLRQGVSRFPLTLPHTPGMEFSGRVVAVGDNVGDVVVGDRVVPLYQIHCGRCEWCLAGAESLCDDQQIPGIHFAGGYAEYVKLPARGLVAIPDGVTFETAAAKNSLTAAWHALVGRARVRAGEWVLVNAAGSGLGSAGVNVARLLGARVIASAGSPEKLEHARAAGAEHTVDYTAEALGERVRELTGGRGVDVVLECVGGELFRGLEALAKNGRLVSVGAHGGEVVSIDLVQLFRHQWTVLGSLRATPAELRQVLAHLAEGSLSAVVDRVLPLAEASEAHRAIEERRLFGKVLLAP